MTSSWKYYNPHPITICSRPSVFPSNLDNTRKIICNIARRFSIAVTSYTCCLLNGLFRQTTKKASKLCITVPVWGEFGPRWFPLTKDHYRVKRFHGMTSWLCPGRQTMLYSQQGFSQNLGLNSRSAVQSLGQTESFLGLPRIWALDWSGVGGGRTFVIFSTYLT